VTLKKQSSTPDSNNPDETTGQHIIAPAVVTFGVKARELARQHSPASCDGLCDWLDHALPPDENRLSRLADAIHLTPDILLRLRGRAADPILVDPAPLVRLAFAATLSYETFSSLATSDHVTFRRAVGLPPLPLLETWLEIAHALWEEMEINAR
jgi:hypothetical protein